MSMALLVQLQEESKRLAVAGSAVAPGDFRIRKLLPPLEAAAAKSPVFGKLAQSAKAVIDSNEKTASPALLELATLVNAILYTQGEVGAPGEMTPIPTTDLGTSNTQTGARVLRPLMDALSTTGSGRVELVRDAIERGTFRDLRLVKPALAALDDPYSEIAELIATKVLPMYGRAIVPDLRATLDLKERGGHLHRLRLLHTLDPEGTREIVRRALEEGSKEIRVVAVECLGTTGPDLAILLEQAKAKAKDVRAAALAALAGATTPAEQVVGVLRQAIDGPDLALCVHAVRDCKLPGIREHVLAQSERQFAETLAQKDVKLQGPAVERLMLLLSSYEHGGDAKSEAFLLKCFESVPAMTKIKSTPSGEDFNERLARVMSRATPVTKQRLVASYATVSDGMLDSVLWAANEILTPEKFFAQFGPVLAPLGKRGKKGADRERAQVLARMLRDLKRLLDRKEVRVPLPAHLGGDDEDVGDVGRPLDPRWIDAAVETGELWLVCEMATPGHAKVQEFFTKALGEVKPDDVHRVLETMVRIGHPAAIDAIIDAIAKDAKSTRSYMGYWYGPMIVAMPRSALPRIEALMTTLPDKVVDQLMDSVMELKAKPE
jgi:hypothetical protein